MLLTAEVGPTKPDDVKIVQNYGDLVVHFGDRIERGLHIVVEGKRESIAKWLGKYDYFIKGSGIPMFEQFTVCHISEEYLKDLEKNVK